MTRLARSLDRLEPHYDVVVVGSGYGGGVSASRLARAGKRVAVLERGREFVTGEFPTRFPDLRDEMQVHRQALAAWARRPALYDVRLGDDMHVLVGCGLGGGSLINAGVALRPDRARVRDPVWPGQIAQDGLLDEGYARAERWVRPARDPAAASAPSTRRCTRRGARSARRRSRAPVAVSFEDTVNPAGVAQPACTRCGDCCGGCNVGAKNTVALTYLPDAVRHGAEIFTHARCATSPRRREGGWRVHFERQDGRRQRRVTRRVRRHGDAGRRHARLDRDPAALARAGASPCRTGWGSASPPTATSSPSATARSCRSTPSASAIRPRSRASRSAPASRARSRSLTSRTWPAASPSRRACCRRRWRRCCRCCSSPTAACSARSRASSPASTRGRSRACRPSSPSRTTAPRAASCSRTTGSRSPGPAPRTSPSTAPRRGARGARAGVPAAATSRTRSPAP